MNTFTDSDIENRYKAVSIIKRIDPTILKMYSEECLSDIVQDIINIMSETMSSEEDGK